MDFVISYVCVLLNSVESAEVVLADGPTVTYPVSVCSLDCGFGGVWLCIVRFIGTQV